MRIPTTLRGLYGQLAASPVPIRSITIPTKEGPLVLEFSVPPGPATAPERKQVAVDSKAQEKPPEAPKVRDTALLNKPAPPMVYES